MDYLQKLIADIEIQSIEGIKTCFSNGIDPNGIHNNKPLIYELINEYPRGPKFKACVKAFIEHGLVMDDEILLAVLSDNAGLLDKQLTQQPAAIHNKYSFNCTFTPLFEASLLHICAEYNHTNCARILLKHGADINARAGTDAWGLGAQSPIFHTVNQHNNYSLEMLEFLLAQGADPLLTVKGLIWGKGYSWETFVPSVNPISYAMMGLLRQFQRREEWIYPNVNKLMKAAYGIDYTHTNIPNAYLEGKW